MSVRFGPGFHAERGRRVDPSAYDRYVGRWSRLLVPTVLDVAGVAASHRVLDVATGSGEASAIALSRVGPSGLVRAASRRLTITVRLSRKAWAARHRYIALCPNRAGALSGTRCDHRALVR